MIQTIPQPETNAAYHGDLTHVSHSALEVFIESPAKYEATYVTGTMERELASPSMLIGSLTHSMILEPQSLNDTYLEAVGCKTRSGGKWQDAVEEAEATGKTPVLPAWVEAAASMAPAVLAHPVAGKLFAQRGVAERSIRWTDPTTGLALKCRPDWLIDDDRLDAAIVVDLKTSADPTPGAFAKSVANYGYHRQAAWYCDGIRATLGKPCRWLWVAVRNEPPHEVYVYQPATMDLLLGSEENTEALIRLSMCLSSGVWAAPGQNEIQTLELPRWARRDQ